MQREGNLEASQGLVAPSFLSRLSLEVGTQAFWGLWKIVPSNNCWKGGRGRFGTGPLSESEPCFGVALADTGLESPTTHGTPPCQSALCFPRPSPPTEDSACLFPPYTQPPQDD